MPPGTVTVWAAPVNVKAVLVRVVTARALGLVIVPVPLGVPVLFTVTLLLTDPFRRRVPPPPVVAPV